MEKINKILVNTTSTCKKYHGDSVEFGKSGKFMVLGILHVRDIPKLMYIYRVGKPYCPLDYL